MRKAKWTWYFYKWRWLWKPYYYAHGLLWKDKHDSPRCEHPPQKTFEWLWFGITIVKEDDDYWEQWLWIKHWCDGDIKEAEETWGWVDMDTKKSTWKDFSK